MLRRWWAPLVAVLVVGVAIVAWSPWSGSAPRGAEGDRERSLEARAEALAALEVDPCDVPTPSEVVTLLGVAAEPEPATDGLLWSHCRWVGEGGTLQVFVSPDWLVFRPNFTRAGSTPLDLGGPRAVAATFLTLDDAAPGTSVELEVDGRFGSVGLSPAPTDPAAAELLRTLARRLAPQLER